MHAPLASPTRDQLVKKFGQAGPLGGWAASVVTDETIASHESDFSGVALKSTGIDRFLSSLARNIKAAGCRKGVPRGEIPYEAWRMFS